MRQKRAAALHDISCFGKCSLTVALPILSAAGIETAVIPTAVLSTHTGFKDYTFRDLTDDILPVVIRWKDNSLEFDAIYTGYLGSLQQIDIIKEVISLLKGNIIIMVDPVMADNGKLYGGFSEDFPKHMATLCAKADIITPNITEACFMLGKPYIKGPYRKTQIEELLEGLKNITGGSIVLTGVYFEDAHLGAACFDKVSGKTSYAMGRKIDGNYHGTGDIFSSSLLGGLLNGKSLSEALHIAVGFVCECICNTKENFTDMWYGVNFEDSLGKYMKLLGKDF